MLMIPYTIHAYGALFQVGSRFKPIGCRRRSTFGHGGVGALSMRRLMQIELAIICRDAGLTYHHDMRGQEFINQADVEPFTAFCIS